MKPISAISTFGALPVASLRLPEHEAMPPPATMFAPQVGSVAARPDVGLVSPHRAIFHTLEAAAISIGITDFHTLAAQPNAFWGALLLRTLQVPQGVIERKCFPWEPTIGTRERWDQYDRLLAVHGVKLAMAQIAAAGLRAFLDDNGVVGIWNAAELERAEAALEGARTLKGIIHHHFADAVAAGKCDAMFVGIETECFPGQDIPGWTLPPVDGRDAVYEALAETYRRTNNPATGTPYVVELLRGKAAFAFPPQPYVLPTIYEIFADGPRRIRLYHLGGTGGVMHLVDDFRDFPVGHPRTRWMPEAYGPDDLFTAAEETHAYTLAAEALGLPNADAVRALKQAGGDAYQINSVVMVKSIDGDIAYFRIALIGDGTATIQPLNGYFDGEGDAARCRTVPAADLPAALAQLRQLIRTSTVQKASTITGLSVEGYGTVQVADEEPPVLELVSPKTRPGEIDAMMPAWQALADRRYVGTTPHTRVSVHTHMQLPTKVRVGRRRRFSIAPLLAIYRAYFTYEKALYGIVPMTPVREGYITRTPSALRALLQDPNVVHDPTDPGEILCILAEIARQTRRKYTALNLDRYIGSLLGAMLKEGVFTPDAAIIVKRWHGRDYHFEIHDGQITWVDGARRTKLIRVPEYAWQPTAELRIFDAVHRQLDPGAYQLDPESTRWFAQFAAAFGWKFGNQPFV